MPIRKRKPTSPGRRFQTVSDFSEITRDRPQKALTRSKPKTAKALQVLETLGLRPAGERPPRVLLVLDRSEHAVWKSFRNLGDRVQIVLPDELNAYDILVNDWMIFSRGTLDAAIARYSSTGAHTPVGEPA